MLDLFLELRFHLVVADHLLVGGVGDALAGAPGLQVVEVGHDQGGGIFLVFPHDQQPVDEGGLLEAVFQELRADVFPQGGLEYLFFPSGDAQEAVLVHLAHVAGVEPSFGIDGFAGELFLLEIAFHDVRPPGQDLPVFRYLHLGMLEGLAHGAELPHPFFQGVHGDDRGSLGKSVSFQDHNAGGGIYPGQPGLQRGATRDDHPDPASQRFPPFAKDQLVGQVELHAVE